MTDSIIAKVERVSHRYGRTVALDDVTIEIPAGRMVGLIGRTVSANRHCWRLSAAFELFNKAV